MGLKYNSDESSQIITAMENNLGIAKQASTGIQSGTQYLTSALVGGSLNGVTFNAGHTLFESIITPAENKVSQALDDVENDLNTYKSADGQVNHYGVLDEDNLNNQINEKKMQQFAANALLDTYRIAIATNPVASLIDTLTGASHQLENLSQSLDEDIKKLQEKLKTLYQFSDQTSPLFRDNLTALQDAMQGVTSLNGMVLNSDGSVPSSYDKSWLKNMEGIKFNSNLCKVEKRDLQSVHGFIISSPNEILGKLFGVSNVSFSESVKSENGIGWTKTSVETRKEGTGIFNFDFDNGNFSGFSINLGFYHSSIDIGDGDLQASQDVSIGGVTLGGSESVGEHGIGGTLSLGNNKHTTDVGFNTTSDLTNGLIAVYGGQTNTVKQEDVSTSTSNEIGRKWVNGKQAVAGVAIAGLAVAFVAVAPLDAVGAGEGIQAGIITAIGALSTAF
ncbi:MAG: hypothetical protein LBI11_03490 [Streptococcaceae bacterium]|jgi:hypothetical protein|nr:hypothetical protein [Streptococcaceae bacterium]